MAKIEAYWDCPYCGDRGIRGRERVCPACGKTRAAETKFYMQDKIRVEDESAVEEGPDWFCPYCDSYNPHSVGICGNCGHPREAEDKDYFSVRQDEERRRREKEEEYARVAGGQSAPEQGGGRPRRSRIIILALAAALLIALAAGLMPHGRAVTVADKAWQRSIEVQASRLAEESDWVLPDAAVEVLRTSEEIHHYDEILDHYETVTETRSREVLDGYDTYTTYNDLGNGYYEEEEHEMPRYRTEYYDETYEEPVYVSVPVYETRYYYTIWRWEYDRTVTASGGADDPYWPEIQYAANEREGGRSERYDVICAGRKGAQTSYVCEPEIWSELDIGGSYKIRTQSGRIVGIK